MLSDSLNVFLLICRRLLRSSCYCLVDNTIHGYPSVFWVHMFSTTLTVRNQYQPTLADLRFSQWKKSWLVDEMDQPGKPVKHSSHYWLTKNHGEAWSNTYWTTIASEISSWANHGKLVAWEWLTIFQWIINKKQSMLVNQPKIAGCYSMPLHLPCHC